jgi:hypothetical protein
MRPKIAPRSAAVTIVKSTSDGIRDTSGTPNWITLKRKIAAAIDRQKYR